MNLNYTKEEYQKEIKQYRKQVWKYTRKEPLFQLDNWGKSNFHLDHIISIKWGFDNNIKPWVIGNIANLRYLCKSENLSKREGKFRCNKLFN